MKNINSISLASKGFVLLSGLGILSISIMALLNPQSVMDLVQVKLNNNDAYSSIRGVYGGTGITFFIAIIYTMRKSLSECLAMLSIFWGLYATSRIITIFHEGSLGAFGNQWMRIELIFFSIAVFLLSINRKKTLKGK
jgi:hypothetical protein